MKYLSRAPQANVAILWVVMRWLQKGPASYDDLTAAVRPAALVSPADDAFNATLVVAADIGLLGANGPNGEWRILEQGSVSADAFERPDRFRSLVRRALLQRAVREHETGGEPSDVAVGLAWLCSLDPSRPLLWGWDGDGGPEQTIQKVGLTDVIVNDTQWRAFRRWAIALGFAAAGNPAPPPSTPPQRLIPDPTAAIADCLPQMPRSLSARVFVDALAAEVPAVDGGALEKVLQERGLLYEARADAALGPAVGHALERLQRRGALTLHKSDDAGQRVSYRVADQTRTFDFISIGVRG
jgi:hypothetical protein